MKHAGGWICTVSCVTFADLWSLYKYLLNLGTEAPISLTELM